MRFLLICIMFFVGCSSNYKYDTSSHYYKHIGGKSVPFRVYGEITEEEAKDLDVYFYAEFLDDERIAVLTKYLNKKIDWVHHYHYDEKRVFMDVTIETPNLDQTKP